MNQMDYEEARFNMIEQQVRPWDVLDQKVLDVMSNVPREAYVPEKYRALAFADRLPAGKHLFEYIVRATIPGRFTAGPAQVEAMYEPDINGRTAATHVEVGR